MSQESLMAPATAWPDLTADEKIALFEWAFSHDEECRWQILDVAERARCRFTSWRIENGHLDPRERGVSVSAGTEIGIADLRTKALADELAMKMRRASSPWLSWPGPTKALL